MSVTRLNPPGRGLRRVEKNRVVAFGETLVDEPSAGRRPAGSACNVASHLAALGVHPVLLTRVGRDSEGQRIEHMLRARGMDMRGVQRDPVRATGQVAGDPDGQQAHDRASDHIHPAIARMIGLSVHPHMVYFSLPSLRGDSHRALRALLDAVDAEVVFDIRCDAPWLDADGLRTALGRARIVLLDAAILASVAARLGLDGTRPAAFVGRVIADYAVSRVVVTQGAAGAWTFAADGSREGVRCEAAPTALPREAGDAFAAVFMLGCLRGWPIAVTLHRADVFARAWHDPASAPPSVPGYHRACLDAWASEHAAAISRMA